MTAELHSQAVISFLNYYYLCYDLCLSHFAAKLLYFPKIIGSFNPVFNKTKRPFNQSHKIYHKSKPSNTPPRNNVKFEVGGMLDFGHILHVAQETRQARPTHCAVAKEVLEA